MTALDESGVHDLFKILSHVLVNKPIEQYLVKRILNVPMTDEEREERYLHSIQGKSCVVRYRFERLQEEKQREITGAIRARNRRRAQKRC